jgi:uncharacterized protein (TIRG00374 family)
VKDLDVTQKKQIQQALHEARYYLTIPVFIILLLSHYVRALRWRLLIQSLGYSPDKLNTFFAVMIGYLANQAFPRLGEVLKCTVLARYEKVPADKLVGTIILERLIDALCLLAIFAITLLIQPELYFQLIEVIFSSEVQEKENNIPGYLIPLGIIIVLLLSVFIWMKVKKKKFSDVLAIFRKIGKRVIEGIVAIRHLKKRTEFIILTFIIWACYLAGGYIGFQALKETEIYGLKEAFTVLSAGSIGMIITPGGIGGYAYLISKSMQMYGLQGGIAVAFGWLLWIAQTIVIVIGGLISFVSLPWHNKRKLKRSIL